MGSTQLRRHYIGLGVGPSNHLLIPRLNRNLSLNLAYTQETASEM